MKEATRSETSIKELFINGSGGDRNGFISEQKFKENIKYARFKISDKE